MLSLNVSTKSYDLIQSRPIIALGFYLLLPNTPGEEGFRVPSLNHNSRYI